MGKEYKSYKHRRITMNPAPYRRMLESIAEHILKVPLYSLVSIELPEKGRVWWYADRQLLVHFRRTGLPGAACTFRAAAP